MQSFLNRAATNSSRRLTESACGLSNMAKKVRYVTHIYRSNWKSGSLIYFRFSGIFVNHALNVTHRRINPNTANLRSMVAKEQIQLVLSNANYRQHYIHLLSKTGSCPTIVLVNMHSLISHTFSLSFAPFCGHRHDAERSKTVIFWITTILVHSEG